MEEEGVGEPSTLRGEGMQEKPHLGRCGFSIDKKTFTMILSYQFAGASAGAGAAAGAGAGALEGAGAGAEVAAGAGAMLDTLTGVLIANDAQMLTTQIKIARLQVAFSMKSVVLR